MIGRAMENQTLVSEDSTTDLDLSLRGVRLSFQDEFHLGPVDLDLRPGEVLALLGASGSGKTTLLRIIAGLAYPDQGIISARERIITQGRSGIAPDKRRMGMVFQDYALFPHMTVFQNVFLKPDQGNADVLELCRIKELAARYPHELSGGQRQRVALARALATSPDILLLDEPFSNLDADLRRHIRGEVISVIQSTGLSAIVVTHDREDAMEMADRVAVVDAGQLLQVDTPGTLYHAPEWHRVATATGQATLLPYERVTSDDSVITELGKLGLDDDSVSLLKHSNQAPKASVLMRPDYLRLDETGSGVACRVLHSPALPGSFATIELPSGTRLHVALPPSQAIEAGATVRVQTIDRKYRILLPAR